MAGKKKSKSKAKTKAKAKGGKDPKGKDRLEAALKKVQGSPGSGAAWDSLEELAAELQKPDEVAELYRKLLGRSKGIAKRALAFHEEWFGDDPDAMAGVLNRILEIEPDAEWAFKRLCVELTQAYRWDELLAVYDKALTGDMEPARRRRLLDDAANVAKDFADEPERALGYLRKLLELEPGDAHLAASMERLYERLGRWAELIELWRGRIPTAGAEAGAIRVRIASTYLERLGEHHKALDELRTQVDLNPEHEGALELLERMLGEDEAPKQVRLGALGLLRSSYDGMKRDEDTIRVIEKGLEFVDRGEVLRKEAARRLVMLGRDEEAMGHTSVLLLENPGDGEARRSLVELAGRSGRYETLARALEDAAASSQGPLRASLLAEAAEVHRDKLEAEGAIELYKRVVEQEDADASVRLEAARTLDDLLAQAGRSGERLAVLRSLARLEQSSSTRRFVIGETARLADEAGEPDVVLEMWRSRIEMDEGDLEALDALVGLYERSEAWDELMKVLGLRARASVSDEQKKADLVRKASVQQKLGDADAAVETLLAVVEEHGYDAATIETLDVALSAAGRWSELVRVLEEASAVAHGRASKLMERLGEVCSEGLNEPARALEFYSSAIVEDPRSEAAREGLRSLLDVEDCALGAAEALSRAYETVDDWEAALGLVEPHLAAAREPEARVRILSRAARIQEERGEDEGEALGSLARAFAMAPGDLWIEGSLRRLGEKTGMWQVVADAYRDAAGAVEDNPPRAALLWCERGRILVREGDEDGALMAFEAAMELDRRLVERDREVVQLLAGLQRKKPGSGLVGTLLCLDGLAPRSLDALHEAARVAMEHGDGELSRSTLEMLYLRGSRLLISEKEAEGERDARSSTAWALEKLVELHREAGNDDRAARLLVDGAGLPLEPETLRDLRLSAASILMERGDANRAMSLLHESLEQSPEDIGTLHDAAAMCEKQGRVTELMALKVLELDLTEELERRLELRLEISRLAARLEQRGGRVEVLLENLEERPGHAPSIDLAVEVLSERGQHGRLADILAEQAGKVEQPERAADLWAGVARIAEEHLGDVQRAVDACMCVVDLGGTSEVLDALARLHLGAGRPEVAAGWLERRLELASEQEKVPTLVKLARARLDARQHEKAVEALDRAFEEAPMNAEVTRLLIDAHRAHGEWEPLVRVLTGAAEHVKDESTIMAYAAEVHDICTTRLGAPEQSVSVLERALAVAPDDRDLKVKLSEALVPAGRYDEAGRLLEELIEGFGRRRSAERAGLHLARARVARAQGDTDAALDHLEVASKMDLSNIDILKALAELARESGKLDRAEHAYRTLLVNVRHGQDEPGPIGPAEVQIELGRIAYEQGQKNKAAELRESAIASLAQDDSQAEGLQENLRAHGDVEMLRRVLETRLARVTRPRMRSRILTELAEILERELDDPQGALEARIQAVESDPVFPPHHEAAQELARKLGEVDRYVSKIESLLEQTRRGSDAYLRCELLLSLGEVMQKDRKDYEQAARLFEQAEETGVREVDAWRARVGLASETGDEKEKARLLELLAGIGEDKADAHASALFSIAEVHLSGEETQQEGLQTMRRALEQDPRYERAGRIMAQASEVHGESAEFMEMWEEIARRSEDERILLGYLERRASSADASHDLIKEAAELAIKFKEWDRAEELMLRAVELGRDTSDETGWAALSLARRRMQADDLDGAVKWLGEASAVAGPARVLEVGREVASRASGPEGDPELVARVYETILEYHPAFREAWEPLASIYLQIGDVDRLGQLVDRTLDSLEDVSDRSTLRLRFAGALMADGQGEEAVEVLHAILSEQPENVAVQSMLVEYLEKAGRVEDLADLLDGRLAEAQERGDTGVIKALSLRLGALRGRSEAEQLYRKAMQWVPEDLEIIEALLGVLPDDHDPAQRAGLIEKVFASKRGDEAAEHALELAELYHGLGDADGVLRVLEAGFAEAPTSVKILARLEQIYGTKGEHEALARRLVEAAGHMDGADVRLDLLRKAANLYREELGNPAAAVVALENALLVSPGNPEIVMEMASAARDSGQIMKAIEKLTHLLETDPGKWTLETLKMRAEMWTAVGDHEAAVEDLEEAFKQDSSLAPELWKGLEQLRSSASSGGDVDAERNVMTRLADLAIAGDRRAEARGLLEGWLQSRSDDLVVLRQLRDFDFKEGNWKGLAGTCETLSKLEKGDGQIKAVLDMTHAYVELGEAEKARKRLEAVHRDHPDSSDVRSALREIYETLDVKEKLARLLQDEADASDDEDEKVTLMRRAAELLIGDGRAGQGVEVLQSAFELRPGDVQIATMLADAFIEKGAHDRAGSILDRVLAEVKGRRTADMGVLLMLRSKIAGLSEDYEAQLEYLEKAFKIDRRNAEIVAEVANVAEKLGNFELAQQALRNVPLVEGKCPISVVDSYLRQARILMMLGDNKRALFCARKALKEDPESEEATNLIAELL